jgi:hypothetical protein
MILAIKSTLVDRKIAVLGFPLLLFGRILDQLSKVGLRIFSTFPMRTELVSCNSTTGSAERFSDAGRTSAWLALPMPASRETCTRTDVNAHMPSLAKQTGAVSRLPKVVWKSVSGYSIRDAVITGPPNGLSPIRMVPLLGETK